MHINRWPFLLGVFFAATAVMIGAFGAHGLQSILTPKALGWVETGARYQFMHAFALLVCGLLAGHSVRIPAMLFTVGVLLFSGSLYVMAFTGITRLGMITPLGGLGFITGWLCLGWCVWRTQE